MDSEPTAPVTLIEETHDHGVAAVCRDARDGGLWLTADRSSGSWGGLEGYEAGLEAVGEVVALAGRAPPRADSAEVRDISGAVHSVPASEGVWLLVVPGTPGMELATVCFRDASGSIVPLPQPGGARVAPIPDAAKPCPACEETCWDLVTRVEVAPEHVIACRNCGLAPLAYFGPEPAPPEYLTT